MTTAFIDEVAVERAAKGEQIRLTPAERLAAVQYLTRWRTRPGRSPSGST